MTRDRKATAGAEAGEVALALLSTRPPDATVCPSEVARALARSAGDGAVDWRSRMSEVHAAVDRLMAKGVVKLSWKGRPLSGRSGPYRIAHGDLVDATMRKDQRP